MTNHTIYQKYLPEMDIMMTARSYLISTLFYIGGWRIYQIIHALWNHSFYEVVNASKMDELGDPAHYIHSDDAGLIVAINLVEIQQVVTNAKINKAVGIVVLPNDLFINYRPYILFTRTF